MQPENQDVAPNLVSRIMNQLTQRLVREGRQKARTRLFHSEQDLPERRIAERRQRVEALQQPERRHRSRRLQEAPASVETFMFPTELRQEVCMNVQPDTQPDKCSDSTVDPYQDPTYNSPPTPQHPGT
jgi:hypothetical protein